MGVRASATNKTDKKENKTKKEKIWIY